MVAHDFIDRLAGRTEIEKVVHCSGKYDIRLRCEVMPKTARDQQSLPNRVNIPCERYLKATNSKAAGLRADGLALSVFYLHPMRGAAPLLPAKRKRPQLWTGGLIRA